jgi:hypothetical protein
MSPHFQHDVRFQLLLTRLGTLGDARAIEPLRTLAESSNDAHEAVSAEVRHLPRAFMLVAHLWRQGLRGRSAYNAVSHA